MARNLPLVALAMVALLPVHAQARPAADASRTAEVLRTDDARIRARAAGDTATLGRIYADDYSLITAEGVVRSKQDQIGELRSGKLHFAPLVPRERKVRLFGDTALVVSRDPAGIVRNGEQIGGDLRMTRVYVRRSGRWQLVSAQATRVDAR
ncbi:MAG: nuclear transport factor 2 family protein [Sphingomonas sp.]